MKKISIWYMKLVIVMSFIITGCTSIPLNQVNDRLQSWKTSNISEVIKYWGIPSKQQEVNGKWYAEWLNKESSPGNTAVSIGSGAFSRHSSIGIGLTLFELGGSDDVCSRMITYQKGGDIVEISWKGTKEYCYEITPDHNKVFANKAIMINQ